MADELPQLSEKKMKREFVLIVVGAFFAGAVGAGDVTFVEETAGVRKNR